MNPVEPDNVQSIEIEDDAYWVQQAREGRMQAWAELHKRYYAKLCGTVVQLLGKDSSMVEDVVQEAFIKAYNQIGKFRGESKFSTWIYRIAVNLALDVARKQTRRQRWHATLHFFGNEEGQEESPIERVAAPEQELSSTEREELGKRLRDEMDRLSPEHRAVVELRLVQELSTEETAKILGCQKGTVLSRLFYACKKLKKALKDHENE
jgi:RNA polymerase sigma-70 factor (ECF subfamily)